MLPTFVLARRAAHSRRARLCNGAVFRGRFSVMFDYSLRVSFSASAGVIMRARGAQIPSDQLAFENEKYGSY